MLAFFGEEVGGGGEFLVAINQAVIFKRLDGGPAYRFRRAIEGVEFVAFGPIKRAVSYERVAPDEGAEQLFLGFCEFHAVYPLLRNY